MLKRRPTETFERRSISVEFRRSLVGPVALLMKLFDRGLSQKMNTQFWVTQVFNGISYGALLFLVGSGLSLIFGVMRIVNLSHGAYFLWGGYIALSVIAVTGSWALSLPVAALAVALIGLVMERLFLRSEGFAYLRNAVIAA